MQKKKLLIGTLLTLLIAGGTYAYSDGGSLQGRFDALAPKGKPDLIVNSISNTADVLTIVVKNSGPGSVTSGTAGQTYVYIDDLTTPNKTYAWTALSDKAFFAAGASSTLEYGSLADGTYEVMVCVDATSLVTERNESNNCLTETVTFEPPMPDLIPDLSATSASMSGRILVDETGTVVDMDIVMNAQCGIKNIGTATASGRNYNSCNFMQTSSYSIANPGKAELTTLSLAPNDTAIFTQTYTYNNPYDTKAISLLQAIHDTGSYTLTVSHSTDYATTHYIDESDETNNTATETITIDTSGITWVSIETTTSM